MRYKQLSTRVLPLLYQSFALRLWQSLWHASGKLFFSGCFIGSLLVYPSANLLFFRKCVCNNNTKPWSYWQNQTSSSNSSVSRSGNQPSPAINVGPVATPVASPASSVCSSPTPFQKYGQACKTSSECSVTKCCLQDFCICKPSSGTVSLNGVKCI